MTTEEHRVRHKELHAALDELAADWMLHQPRHKLFSNSTIMELMRWSHQQTVEPSPLPEDEERHPDDRPLKLAN